MIEHPGKKHGSQEVPPEKGWASFVHLLRWKILEADKILIKANPADEAAILAKSEKLEKILIEIAKAGPESRRQLIENSWQERKIPEDIYKKLVGRMEVEARLEGLVREVGLGGRATQEKITGPEAAKEVAEELREVIETKSFWSRFREKIAGKINPAEIWQKFKEKKILGQIMPAFLTGLGTGAAVRTTVRWGLGALTGGAGYALAISSGAVSGAILEAIRTYRKESGRKLSEAEFLQKITEKSLEGDARTKLDRYLKLTNEKETAELSGEKQKLYEELKREQRIKSVRWGQVMKGVGKGALIGAVGGVVGGYLAHLAEGYFAPAELKEAAKEAKALLGETLKEEVHTAAADAYGKTLEKSLEAGLETLKEKSFSVSIEKGDGFTRIARKLIHDYVVQSQTLGENLKLDKAQFIYAEDTLSKTLEHGDEVIQPGYSFTTDGEAIAKAIERAKNLSEIQLKNLEENFVPKIAEKTWQEITDYGSVYNEGNNVAGEIIASAREKSAEAAQKIVKEAMQRSAGVQKISSQAVEAKDAWFKDNWAKYGFGAAWTAAAASAIALGYRLGRKSGGGSEDVGSRKHTNPALEKEEKRVGAIRGSEVGAAGSILEQSGLGGAEIEKPEKITGETNLHLRKVLTEKIGNNIEIAGSDFSTGLEMEHDGLKRLEQLIQIDKNLFGKIKGSLLYMTTDKTAEIGRGNKGRVIIPIDPKLTSKGMRRYLEDAVEKIKNLG